MSLVPLPSPPTDSLYKFLAISGLVLTLAGPVYWATFSFALAEKRVTLEATQLDLRDQILEWGSLPAPPDADTAKADPDAVRRNEALWSQQLEKVAVLKRSERTAALQHRLYSEQLLTVTVLSVLGVILGGLGGLIGFRLWYRRVQHFQDILLQRQAQSAATSKEAAA